MKIFVYLICCGICLFAAGNLSATELVYTPVNPSFGGNALNGSVLLGQAQAQDRHKDPSFSSSLNRDPMDYFEESLVRRVLSNLAGQIVDDAFGNSGDPLQDGFYQFGDYTIDVLTSSGDSVVVTITDLNTGNATTVEVPTNYGL